MSIYVTVDSNNSVVGVVTVPNPGGKTIDEVFPGNPEYTATLIQADAYPDIAAGWIGSQVGSDWTFVSFESAPGYIDQARASKKAEIEAACTSAIVSGFSCDALGAGYTYPSKVTDQLNLSSSVLASLMPDNAADWTTPFWCADASGLWAYREHTVAQIQAVGQVGKAQVLAFQAINSSLQAKVAAATTVEAVQAITWEVAS